MLGTQPLEIARFGLLSCAAVAWRSPSALRLTVVAKAAFALRAGGDMVVAETPPLDREVVPYLPAADITLTYSAYTALAGLHGQVTLRLGVMGPRGAVLDRTLEVDPSDPSAPNAFAPLPVSPRQLAFQQARATVRVADLEDDTEWSGFHTAPPEQRVAYLSGNEWVALEGVNPHYRSIQSRLPDAATVAWLMGADGARQELPMVCDMLHIDADALRCTVAWRGSTVIASESSLAGLKASVGLSIGGRVLDWSECSPLSPPPRSSSPQNAPPMNSSSLGPSLERISSLPPPEASRPESRPPPEAPPVVPSSAAPPPHAPVPTKAQLLKRFGAIQTGETRTPTPPAQPKLTTHGTVVLEGAVAVASTPRPPPHAAPTPRPPPHAAPTPNPPPYAAPTPRPPPYAAPPSYAAPPYVAPPYVVPPDDPSTAETTLLRSDEELASGAMPPLPFRPAGRIVLPLPSAPTRAERSGHTRELELEEAPDSLPFGGRSPSTSPAAPRPTPSSSGPSQDDLGIDACAAIAAQLSERGATRAAVLAAHGLSEPQWLEVERRWADALDAEERAGGAKLGEAYDNAFVKAWESLRPSFELPHYAQLHVASQGNKLGAALETAGVRRTVWARLKRVWAKRIAADKKLAAAFEREVARERRR